jgi:RND family efflux transporter MFP subunit
MMKIPFARFAVFLGIPFAAQSQESDDGFKPILTYLEPYRSIEISAVESGVIREILVKEGDRVAKDQPLLKLDTEVIEARLAIAEAQAKNTGRILAMQSDFQLNKDRYDKLTSLKGKGVSNEFEIQGQYATMKASEGLLIEANEQKAVYELQVAQIKAEIERRILRSPIDGFVVEIVKDIAEAVSAVEAGRDDYLLRVVMIDQLKATAHVPAELARSLKIGDRLSFRIAEAGFQTAPPGSGTIEFVSPVIESTSNTVRIRLRIENADHTIPGGSAARLLIPLPAS